ncbi:MAG TPA: Gfo/Idh/MocA family oxidoreductase [Opitutaceae bacterium]|nr:Gfo/Idh/MocA family oxidoreductase [Opitutaceae bacterium]
MSSPTASPSVPRRDFLKTSAALAAGTALVGSRPLTAAERTRSIGANDRIRIGIIGCGERGRNAHMEGIYKHVGSTNFEIVGLCDPWKVARDKANAMVKNWFGREAKTFTTYRDLLAMEGLDAVMIASPDFHHTTHLEAAAKAGKHIYVEKPLATEMDKLVRAYDAVKKAGTVVQVGTQLRSLPSIMGAREVVKSGLIGKLSRVEECRNGEKPYWYSYLPRVSEAKAEDIDWKEFLGDRPKRPFDARQFVAWYGYYEFCQGPIPQWGAHFLDMAHFITSCSIPESCVCTGGIFTWKDENKFTVPDCVQADWIYPEGFLLTSSNNFGNGFGESRKFFGDKGVLKAENWNAPTYSPEGGPRRDGKIRGQNAVTPIPQPDHFLNWLQCIRTGETPHASIDAGFQHAVAVLMAVRSYETGRKIVYHAPSRSLKNA